MNLIIFTASYPYDAGAEQTFIGRELPFLSRHFESIVVIPKKSKGKLVPIPEGVQTEEKFAALLRKRGLSGVAQEAFCSRLFYQDIISRPEILIHIMMLARLVRFVGEAELLRKWLAGWIEEKRIDVNQTLFYSFWFDQLAMGVGLLKESIPQLKLVSRAHGYDIYEHRYNPPYWPCRRYALTKLDKLFLASGDAQNYMLKRYPQHSALFETAHLGVPDPGFTTSASQDGVLRIVSCASLVGVKRIDLLANGVHRAAQLRPEQQFDWRHFGDGPAMRKLQEMSKRFPRNVKSRFDGYIPNEQIMAYYRENPVDVIVNVSESEGGSPVSIMEAASCGIPAIATAVGGNPEIVSERNGTLLSANPTPEEIAEALLQFLGNPEDQLRKRRGSRTVWLEKYNAAHNFAGFADRLKVAMGVPA